MPQYVLYVVATRLLIGHAVIVGTWAASSNMTWIVIKWHLDCHFLCNKPFVERCEGSQNFSYMVPQSNGGTRKITCPLLGCHWLINSCCRVISCWRLFMPPAKMICIGAYASSLSMWIPTTCKYCKLKPGYGCYRLIVILCSWLLMLTRLLVCLGNTSLWSHYTSSCDCHLML